ncbi:hypothetical protein [Carboxylicivirga sp. N1Y90]|uniref:hypothetical protein n=1 Tax=Carboxylicivirga fragile TaxID=3417571 RepID=UPI003D34D3E3|nr:hypothetical protein [Marinilabiliaceae bacterium N1Y90]
MGTIKMFMGNNPPLLKTGEWASNGIYAYLGIENGDTKIFQSVFDPDKEQTVAGFTFDSKRKQFNIPKDTPLSKIQLLIDSLPKSVKLKSGDDFNGITLMFETGDYIDDTQAPLTIRDFSYMLTLKGSSYEDVNLVVERPIEIRKSTVNFYYVNIWQKSLNTYLLQIKDSILFLTEQKCLQENYYYFFKDKGNNQIFFSETEFQSFENGDAGISGGSFVFYAISPYSQVFAYYHRYSDNVPDYICRILYGQLKIADNIGAKKAYGFLENTGTFYHGSFDSTNPKLPTQLSSFLVSLEAAGVKNIAIDKDKNQLVFTYNDNKKSTIEMTKPK